MRIAVDFSCRIRPFSSNQDIDFAYNVFNDPRVLAGHGLKGPSDILPRRFFAEAWGGKLTSMGSWWIFEANGVPDWERLGIGTINQWMPNPTTAEVALSIVPTQWNKGWGRKLLALLEREASVNNIEYLWAGIIESNIHSESLFRSTQYMHVATIPFYAPQPQDSTKLQQRQMYVKEL